MKTKEPKRQHYVPKLYLRRFSKKINKKYEIFVYDKIRRNIFKTKIDKVALENDLYTDCNFEDNYFLEKYFGREIEPIIEKTLKHIEKICFSYKTLDTDYVIPEVLKMDLSYVIAFQFLRGPYTLETGNKIAPKIAKEYIDEQKKVLGVHDNAFFENLLKMVTEKTFIKNITWEQMFRQERMDCYAQNFYDKHWIFYIFKEDVLLTCDRPVIIKNRKTNETKPFNVGLNQDDTVVYFAVNPRLLIILYSKNSLLYMCDRRICFMENECFASEYNKANFDQCKAQVYANSENLLKSAIKYNF